MDTWALFRVVVRINWNTNINLRLILSTQHLFNQSEWRWWSSVMGWPPVIRSGQTWVFSGMTFPSGTPYPEIPPTWPNDHWDAQVVEVVAGVLLANPTALVRPGACLQLELLPNSEYGVYFSLLRHRLATWWLAPWKGQVQKLLWIIRNHVPHSCLLVIHIIVALILFGASLTGELTITPCPFNQVQTPCPHRK